MMAAKDGNLDCVKYFVLSKGSDLEGKNKHGKTALYYLAAAGHLECFKFLCSKGADVNVGGEGNRTALHGATKNGHLNVIEFVLNETNFNKGINYKSKNGETAVYMAAHKGHLDIFKFLYSKGADVNVVNIVSFFFFLMNFIRNLKILIIFL